MGYRPRTDPALSDTEICIPPERIEVLRPTIEDRKGRSPGAAGGWLADDRGDGGAHRAGDRVRDRGRQRRGLAAVRPCASLSRRQGRQDDEGRSGPDASLTRWPWLTFQGIASAGRVVVAVVGHRSLALTARAITGLPKCWAGRFTMDDCTVSHPSRRYYRNEPGSLPEIRRNQPKSGSFPCNLENARYLVYNGLRQSDRHQSSFGTKRSQVQILSPRFFAYPDCPDGRLATGFEPVSAHSPPRTTRKAALLQACS